MIGKKILTASSRNSTAGLSAWLRLHTSFLMAGLRAAFDVGYESISQFTLEYRRLFGQPLMRDVKVQRLAS
jgi:AraC-like DNA-binding protein